MMEISILENVQREDLNPIEEAAAYESLVKKLGYTQEKLAERVGKSREYCANMMRLLKLPSEVQQLVIEKKLTNGHVRPLLSLEDDGAIYDAATKIVHDKMSVREVEKYVHELNGTEKKAVKPEKKKDPMIRDLENRMLSFLKLIVDKGRAYYLQGILEDYIKLANEDLGVELATVTSARKLSAEDMKTIGEALVRKTNKKVVLRNKIDPSVISGIKVTIGNNVTDATMATKIEKLRSTLLKGGQA